MPVNDSDPARILRNRLSSFMAKPARPAVPVDQPGRRALPVLVVTGPTGVTGPLVRGRQVQRALQRLVRPALQVSRVRLGRLGVTGVTGATGPAGTGPTGPTGVTGAAGAGIGYWRHWSDRACRPNRSFRYAGSCAQHRCNRSDRRLPGRLDYRDRSGLSVPAGPTGYGGTGPPGTSFTGAGTARVDRSDWSGGWRRQRHGNAYTASSTPPGSANPGDLWYDLSTGVLSIYINDGTCSQWVQIAAPAVAGLKGSGVRWRRWRHVHGALTGGVCLMAIDFPSSVRRPARSTPTTV